MAVQETRPFATSEPPRLGFIPAHPFSRFRTREAPETAPCRRELDGANGSHLSQNSMRTTSLAMPGDSVSMYS